MATKKKTVTKKKSAEIEAWVWSIGSGHPDFYNVKCGNKFYGLYRTCHDHNRWQSVSVDSAKYFIANYDYIKASPSEARRINRCRLKGVRP